MQDNSPAFENLLLEVKILADPKLPMHACLHKVFTNFAELAV
jgi:hypothetical protein